MIEAERVHYFISAADKPPKCSQKQNPAFVLSVPGPSGMLSCKQSIIMRNYSQIHTCYLISRPPPAGFKDKRYSNDRDDQYSQIIYSE
jgi:hypothetical protein